MFSSFKYPFLILISIGFLSPLLSQGHWDGILPEKKENTVYKVFAENVNIRKEPNLKADVVTKLQPGNSVKVLKKTTTVLTQGKVKEYWYKIKTGKEEGYVWGGLLSDYHLTLGKHEILVRNLGVLAQAIEIKALSDSKLVSELKLNPGPVSNEAWKYKVYPANSFKPAPGEIFGLHYLVYSEIEYGYPEETFITLKDGNLTSHFSRIPGMCDPPSCAESWLLFPEDVLAANKEIGRKAYKGKPNTILEISRHYDLDDSSAQEYFESEYIWNGKIFKAKEQESK
ncbi:SH3 domain-containing protein [Leptospira sp. 'Mane']|uniref:SH3 domain-containing protein n=1 Tax=Leptospira sp. 'Mane' TaxID=3387407 RepID=UPI00398AEA76